MSPVVFGVNPLPSDTDTCDDDIYSKAADDDGKKYRSNLTLDPFLDPTIFESLETRHPLNAEKEQVGHLFS